MDNFQTRLKQAMFVKGVRQIDLANRTNIERTKICSYLKGRYMPNAEAMTKIADALGVSQGWLLGQGGGIEAITKDPAIDLSTEEMDLIERYRKADETKKQIVRLILGM